MKTVTLFAMTALSAFATEQQRELPVRFADPLPAPDLLAPGERGPDIVPAPETLPFQKAGATLTGGTSAKATLRSAADDYRKKTELFRKGKISRDALRASATRVALAAKAYRAIVGRH